jgi:hypothetical protein
MDSALKALSSGTRARSQGYTLPNSPVYTQQPFVDAHHPVKAVRYLVFIDENQGETKRWPWQLPALVKDLQNDET